ncbi:MAG: YnfA family protein [Candidatus Heimdallarchaeota archaeon]
MNLSLSLFLFFLAAFLEIGGGYLIWVWRREQRSVRYGLYGGLVLFVYGIIPTLQTSSFGKVYAAYGGIFIVASIIWGKLIDKKSPDRYELLGGLIVLIGAFTIFYVPR